jgi:hypothetical protein
MEKEHLLSTNVTGLSKNRENEIAHFSNVFNSKGCWNWILDQNRE